MSFDSNRNPFFVIFDDGDTSVAGKWVVIKRKDGSLVKDFVSQREANAYRDYLNMLWR